MNFKKILAAAAVLSLSTASQAGILFSDNFNAELLGLNHVPAGWSVTSGSVDVVSIFDFLPRNPGHGHGHYIDLDGTTRHGGTLVTSLMLTGGVPYAASFDLAGNARDAGNEIVTVDFGSTRQVYTLDAAEPFANRTLRFTPDASGLFSLSFANAGGDDRGALLDNVLVGSVPEPQTYALLAAGLLAVGFMSRRRNIN